MRTAILCIALAPAWAMLATPAQALLLPQAQEDKPTSPIAFTREVEAGEHVYTADFGRLEVPQIHAKPDGPRLAFAFVRLRTTASKAGPPLFFLPGVPNSGTGWRDEPFWSEYLELGDVVLIDARGAGESKPQLIWQGSEWRPELLFADRDTARDHVLACAKLAAAEWRERGVDLAAFTAVEMAADVDALRKALGYEKVHLAGHSAGSHVALEVVRSHGEGVAKLVSFGTAGPHDVHKLPGEMDASLRAVAKLVAADPSVGKQMPDLFGEFARLVKRLDEKPLAVPVALEEGQVEVTLGGHGLALLVAMDLGDETDLPVLPRLLATVGRGDPSLVRWFLEKRMSQMSAMPLILFAARAPSGASKERWARIDEEALKSPFGRVRTLFSPEIDAVLGLPDLGESFRRDVQSAVPALFVSGGLDANTPPEQAEKVRRGFKSSAHVVLENTGHDTILHSPELRERVLRFLAGKDVKDERIAAPTIRFAPIEGAVMGVSHPALAAR
jgi:pimeloyl-ACP methyl ester carboxylesterase